MDHCYPLSPRLSVGRQFAGWAYVSIACLLLVPDMVSAIPHVAIAVILGVLVTYDLLKAVDDSPAIREVAGLIAVLQYVIGPSILYAAFNQHARYRMYVDENQYFGFAVPATCLFLVGLRLKLPIGTTQFRVPTADKEEGRVGMALVAIGLASGVMVKFGPASLAFVFYLLANLRYVGAIYVYNSGQRWRWPVIAAVAGGIYFTSATNGMFHEALLWGSLGGCYWFIGKQRTWATKIIWICAAVMLVVLIQSVKPVLRAALARGEAVSLMGVTGDLVQSDEFLSEGSLEYTVVRISQGWIVSAAMYAVPHFIEHANGETIIDAVAAAVLPRVLVPEKREASSRENVNKYTFLEVGRTTAMGLGPLGECWVNFGLLGGVFAMFSFGVLLNAVFHVVAKMSWIDSFFYFCLPIVFLQAVKAETEFLTVFNHLTKSMILVCGMYYGLREIGLFRGRGAR